MSGHVRLEKLTVIQKFTVIQKNKTNQENEQPTMGVLPKVPHKLDQNSIPENP
jgi:hypothetical protein